MDRFDSVSSIIPSNINNTFEDKTPLCSYQINSNSSNTHDFIIFLKTKFSSQFTFILHNTFNLLITSPKFRILLL